MQAYPQAQSGWLDLLPTDPVKGPTLAPITIVAFSDFQCPYCKRGFETLEQLAAANPDKIRIVWKDFPLAFHLHAREAARLGRVVFLARGHEAFYRYHEAAYGLGSSMNADSLRAAAVAEGADASVINKYGWDATRLVDASIELGKKLGVTGTPQFYINGEPLTGAQSQKRFQAIVDAQLVEVNELAKKGVSAPNMYRAMLARHAPKEPQ